MPVTGRLEGVAWFVTTDVNRSPTFLACKTVINVSIYGDAVPFFVTLECIFPFPSDSLDKSSTATLLLPLFYLYIDFNLSSRLLAHSPSFEVIFLYRSKPDVWAESICHCLAAQLISFDADGL